MHCTRKKTNLPDPSPPLQDDISRRGNLDSVLLAPTPRCAVGRYALENTIRISPIKISNITSHAREKTIHRIRFAPSYFHLFPTSKIPTPQTSQAPIPPLPLPPSNEIKKPPPKKKTYLHQEYNTSHSAHYSTSPWRLSAPPNSVSWAS